LEVKKVDFQVVIPSRHRWCSNCSERVELSYMRFKITSLQFSIIIIISRVQIVAAILWLQFMVQVMLLLLLPSSFLFHSSLA